jgi:hypothetical protein
MTREGWVSATVTPDEDAAYFQAAGTHLDRLAEASNTSDLEAPLGAVVDRLLLAKGIASVDSMSRLILLQAFHLALRDALELRKRNAGGDYFPDPKAVSFPNGPRPMKTPSRQQQRSHQKRLSRACLRNGGAKLRRPAESPAHTRAIETRWPPLLLS